MKARIRASAGFTLVELVAAIVISALALAAVLPLMDRVFLRSHEPRLQLRDGLELHAAMEDLVARHTNRLEGLRQHVGPEGALLLDGRFTVVDNHYVSFTPGRVEQADALHTNLLKITLRGDGGEQVTRLFTEPL
jgi:prepilin-type N-terminal cleavage/methylation domain-containing protein